MNAKESKPGNNRYKDKQKIPDAQTIDDIFSPDHILDTERAVLGALLLETEAIARVKEDFLKIEYFGSEKHRIIYSAILRVAVKSGKIDILTVAKELKDSGELEKAGNYLYVTQLTSNVASSIHLREHVLILKDVYEEKQKQLLKRELVERAESGEDIENILSDASERITKPTNQRTPEMPIDGLPDDLQALINAATGLYGGHRDFWTASIISASAVAIGAGSRLITKYINYPILWFVIVCPSGANKSEPMDFAFFPLRKKDEENKEVTKDSEPKQFILSDFTPESLVKVHSNNPRGVCIKRDEITAWLQDIGRYSKSGELQNYLSAWSGISMVYNRMEKTLTIPHPIINILGSIQNALTGEFFKDFRSESGFLQRFCWIYPDNAVRQIYKEEKLPNLYTNMYHKYIEKLLEIENKDIVLSKEAHNLYGDYVNANTNEINRLTDNTLRSIIAKLDIIPLRLTNVIHCSKWAFSGGEMSTEVSADTMEYAIRICSYLRITAEKVLRSSTNLVAAKEVVNKKSVTKFLYSIGNTNKTELAKFLKTSRSGIDNFLKP